MSGEPLYTLNPAETLLLFAAGRSWMLPGRFGEQCPPSLKNRRTPRVSAATPPAKHHPSINYAPATSGAHG